MPSSSSTNLWPPSGAIFRAAISSGARRRCLHQKSRSIDLARKVCIGSKSAIVNQPRKSRGFAEQVRQQMLPPFGISRGAVAAGLGRGRDQVIAAVLHALDFAIENSKFRQIALVVG